VHDIHIGIVDQSNLYIDLVQLNGGHADCSRRKENRATVCRNEGASLFVWMRE
jgi:hypothetical protein